MSISSFFENTLKAPLTNIQWSWGAWSTNGQLFLRVWEDEIDVVDGKQRVVLINKKSDNPSQGRPERERQLAGIRDDSEVYGVILYRDPQKERRSVKNFIRDRLLRLGRLIEDHDCIYAEVLATVSVSDVVT